MFAHHIVEELPGESCLHFENAWDGYHIGYRFYTCANSEHSCRYIDSW